MDRFIFAALLWLVPLPAAADPGDELVPVRLADGRYLLAAPFPAGADRLCFRFLRAVPQEDTCVERPVPPAPLVAAAAVELEEGDVVYAVALDATGESPLSGARWVVPAAQ